MSLSKYFSIEGRAVNQRFMGADGYDNADAVPYMGANGQYFMANAPAPVAEAPSSYDQYNPHRDVSQPIILNVSNSSSLALTAVMFGAAYNIAATNQGNPTGITITSYFSTVTYLQVLQQSQTNPMKFMLVKILNNSTGSAVQANPITVTYYDIFGRSSSVPSIVTRDPYQQQTDIVLHRFNALIDGSAQFSFSMPAASSYQFQFYPQGLVNQTRQLNGAVSQKDFDRPGVSNLLDVYTGQ